MTQHTRVVVPRYIEEQTDGTLRCVRQPSLRDALIACADALAAGVPADALLVTGGYDLTCQWETQP